MNRGVASRLARTNTNSSRGRSGALTYRSHPNNNEISSRSRGQGNLGGATNPINGNFSLNTSTARATGTAVASGIRIAGHPHFGSNFFGSTNGNLGYGLGNSGFGNSGYGYGNGGNGYGIGGAGLRVESEMAIPSYVMVYLPGVGWAMVPIRAIRGF